ncbi:MAG: hypothetical protein M3495_12595, partial [Pseudomonadota bacterium]|nr:hypothetical protein [Pseudomonadota bacterium]
MLAVGLASTDMDTLPSTPVCGIVHPTRHSLREANGGSSVPSPPLDGEAAVSGFEYPGGLTH